MKSLLVLGIRSLALLGFAVAASSAPGVTKVVATSDRIVVSGDSTPEPSTLVEINPGPANSTPGTSASVAQIGRTNRFQLELPRFDANRDRLYSGFVLLRTNASSNASLVGSVHFVEDMEDVSKSTESFPNAASKKGLQVQMVDDALALGIKHAAINVNLTQLPDLSAQPSSTVLKADGESLRFNVSYLDHLDRQIKPLSDAGVLVSLILLTYESGDPALNKVMLHPKYDRRAPNHLGAFNTVTPEGVKWFKACIELVAERYSRLDRKHGRAVNFIVGNEVNSHWYWANMGPVSMEEFALDYLTALRLCHTAVRKFSASCRVYVSLEHHWGIRYDRDSNRSFEGRRFIDYFARAARVGGDFDWHVAYHPYPENLFDCRFWNDKTALKNPDTPRITFKNIEVLVDYFRRPELLFRGQPRRIILSEQGFHSPLTPEGEALQAAAYCLAWNKVSRLDGIDSFILHRHVDHGNEGGLNLGLWARNPAGSNPAEPVRRKPLYEVFRAADTSEWEKAFRFALPIVELQSWPEQFHPNHASDENDARSGNQ
ncbi:MAG: hypothetical protein EXS31_10850 [Pedosphaera sp.]|nr:hypothetical protein [Pedosphaera sp.]